MQVGTQTGWPNIGGYWAVSQYTVQYPGILDGIPGYRMVSQDTGRYPDTGWYPDTVRYPDTVQYPDIHQYPDAAVAWRTDTDTVESSSLDTKIKYLATSELKLERVRWVQHF